MWLRYKKRRARRPTARHIINIICQTRDHPATTTAEQQPFAVGLLHSGPSSKSIATKKVEKDCKFFDATGMTGKLVVTIEARRSNKRREWLHPASRAIMMVRSSQSIEVHGKRSTQHDDKIRHWKATFTSSSWKRSRVIHTWSTSQVPVRTNEWQEARQDDETFVIKERWPASEKESSVQFFFFSLARWYQKV